MRPAQEGDSGKRIKVFFKSSTIGIVSSGGSARPPDRRQVLQVGGEEERFTNLSRVDGRVHCTEEGVPGRQGRLRAERLQSSSGPLPFAIHYRTDLQKAVDTLEQASGL
jgi:hypothetical protein